MRAVKIKVRPWKGSKTSKPGWVLRSYLKSHPPEKKNFRTEAEAKNAARAYEAEISCLGVEYGNLTTSEKLTAAQAFRRLKAKGRNLKEAIDHFLSYIEQHEKSSEIGAIIDEYLLLKNNQRLKKRSIRDITFRLEKFRKTFGTQIASNVTLQDLEKWIYGLKGTAQTKNNFRAILHGLFEYCTERGYCSSNPVKKIRRINVEDKPPKILTPEQLQTILEIALKIDPEMIPPLAIGAFAGLRTAEIDHLEWSEICFDRNTIEIKTEKSKTARRRIVDMLPNLRAWLELSEIKEGKIGVLNYFSRKNTLIKKIGMSEWPDNGLRHSYASYHYAANEDAAKLAAQMGHRNSGMIFNHYRALVKKEAAEKYWSIMPSL